VVVPDAQAYAVASTDDVLAVASINVDDQQVGLTARFADQASGAVASSVVGGDAESVIVSYSTENEATKFMRVARHGKEVTETKVEADTGLAASDGSTVMYMEPIQGERAQFKWVSLGDGKVQATSAVSYTPDRLAASKHGFAAVGRKREGPVVTFWSPGGGSVSEMAIGRGVPIGASWPEQGPLVVFVANGVPGQYGSGAKAVVVKAVPAEASLVAASASTWTYNDGKGNIHVTSSGGETTVVRGVNDESLLGLEVTEAGNVAALYPTQVMFIRGGKTTMASLNGESSTQWD